MMKKTKKSNAKRKFAAAAAMLLISALVLSSATYAWFTMSKEVEVKNIQLTATAPVNVQLSLGLNMYSAMTDTSAKLTAGNAAGGIVSAPANDDASKDWTNTVSFYDFYQVPKLVPASSNDGAAIWATDAMTGVGRTIVNGSGTSVAASEATMTLIASPTAEPLSGTTPAYNQNNYIDFPVWFRTSSEDDIKLKVEATTMEGEYDEANPAGSGTDLALYKAARVAILNSTDGSTWTSKGVIIPKVDGTAQSNKYYAAKALSSSGTIGSDGTEENRTGAYAAVSEYDGKDVVTIPGSKNSASVYSGGATNSSAVYGKAVCVIVRVWLEGEDKDCWNATEGQNFKINLKFTEYTTP